MTIINRPVTGATRTMKRIVPLLGFAVALLALPAYAELVGLYTFDRTNPLEAVIGSPAKEGVTSGNNQQPVLSDTISTISLVSDGTVLGARTGVVAVPARSTLAIPNPGLAKNWTIVLPFYCPDTANWRCFFKFDPSASADGSLFIKNNSQIGAGSYDNTSGIVGAWHQLTVSSANGTQTIWYDTTKLGQTRSWNIAGLSLLLFSFDNSAEDALMYLDDIRLYDETAPTEVFPNGTSGSPTIFAPYAESPYADDFASFSRPPDQITEDAPYRTYVFRRHGTFTFTPVKQRNGCSALFVGGGGAGGLQRGGGGGGGGVVAASDLSFLAQSYTATVGAGGIPAIHTSWYQNGSDANKLHEGVTPATACGGDTILSAGGGVLFTAHGGGGGGNFNYAGSNKPGESYGLAGASGGGSSGKSTVRAAGIDGEGYAGGAATTDGDNSAGGGGGASSAGADGTKDNPGAGGDGVESSITGTAVVYGGGGGGGGGYGGNNVGAGGAGGGGTGVSSSSARARTTASNGTDGLGGGGGGGSGQNNNPICSMGGRGGDGTVILRILMTSDDDPEPTVAVSTSGIGYTNATFNVRLLSLGSGAGSADVVFQLSENADMSNPFFETTVADDVAEFPASFAVSYGPLRTNTLYYAQATALNNLDAAGVSALFSFTTLNPEPPTVAATPAGAGFGTISATVTLSSFGAGSVDATLYLECSASGAFDDVVSSPDLYVDALPFAQVFTTTGLEAGLSYSYRVRAVNTWGLEGFSQTFTVATDATPVRLSEISAIPAGDGLETITVAALDVEPGSTYSLSISVDGSVVRTWTDQTGHGTFSVTCPVTGSHTAIAQVSCSYGGNVYTDSRSASFSAGGSRIVVADYADHCSAATSIRVKPGDTIVLPELPWGLSYRVLNERFLSLDGLEITALEPAVAGVEICSGSSVVDTMAVLVLPEAIKGGDVYIYDEKASESDRWNRAATWTKIGSATDGEFPSRPNDIAVIPFYDITGTKYVRHDTDLSLGGLLFGQFRDVEAECVLERHSSTGTHTLTFERADGEPAFVKVTPNTTTSRENKLRFGGYEILVNCVSSVIADSCSGTTSASLNRGKITYSACTIHIPAGKYWAVDGLPGYDLNMGGTIGPPQLTGEGTFWKKGMGGITFDKQNDFHGMLLDTGHGHLGGYNRAASIFWNGGGGTNVSITVAGWSPPRLGNPAEDSSSGYGRFRTGWEHFYGAEDAHPDVPWNPRKTMTLRGGAYIAYSTQNGPSWGGPGSKSLRLYEKLVVGPGRSYVSVRGNTSNKDGHPTNWVQWDDLEHADKGTLVLFDWSRRSVAATQDSTNSVAMLPRHAAFLVGHGSDGDCLESDVYPIVPWIVAPTSTDDSSWRNTLFASFDADGRLTQPIWNNTAIDAAASPFSNAYLWDKTIEIGHDVTVNSLFMNNSGKNKWLGAGRTLTITSGGLVMHNNNTAIGQPGRTDNGSLVLGDANHPGYVFAKASNASQPNQIWADVTAPGGFVSSYSGALVLGGSQTNIAGEIVVNAGVLTLGTAEYDCKLASDLPIRICAGATLELARVDTVKRNTMWFDGAAGQFGKIELPEGIAAKCKKAYWRDYPETDEWHPILRGIYTGDAATALAVGAIYDPDHFSGTGTMEVLRDDSVIPLVLRLR